jgi:hypothetical protein
MRRRWARGSILARRRGGGLRSTLFGRTAPNFPERKPAAKSPELLRLDRRILRGTSRYFGVTRRSGSARPWYFQLHWCPDRSRWSASIRVRGKSHFMGEYKDEETAARAFEAAARRLLGKAALRRLNFPR